MNKIIGLMVLTGILLTGCKVKEVQNTPPENFTYNPIATGPGIEIIFRKGESHNHPLMAIWVEEINGNFVQTLYVAKSIGTGTFEHGKSSQGKWQPGEIKRPAALPVWGHKRGIQSDDGLFLPDSKHPVADAYTGATPTGDFNMVVHLDSTDLKEFNVFFEINQSWDWNEYWTNNKYPDDANYKTSAQPSLVYKATINLRSDQNKYPMVLIGHGHYSGKNGTINNDLSTITTAKNIVKEVFVKTE